ncbi:MAG: asparagine synthase [Rhodospirillaceae bacterium]|jgi:asparagine synthase (glutamine-hydrolysing)|nr:asparagine synthase [Rhodospirillaceae bacterium]MBT5455854.1 asparagine synthase [Rhodospirillaceae bacterium]
MTGLCGWVGITPSADPNNVLSDMAGGLMPVAGQADDRISQPNAALYVRGWSDSVHLHQEKGVMAAMVGDPEWSDPAFATIARERGHGAALIAAYGKHQNNLFSVLHGPFSLAVVSPDQGVALIAIDRMGVHGLCYATPPGGGLVFGTDTDAVRAHPAVTASITPQTLFNFISFYVCPAPMTIYREQHKLLAAQYLAFDGAAARARTYWEIPYCEDGPVDENALREELHTRLRSAVSGVVKSSDQSRTGAFLSGGLDSSTVCGMFSEVSDGPAKAFTISFTDPRYDESSYADICARHFDLESHKYTLTLDDASSFLPRLAAAYDEPFGNSSAIPTYFCAQMAAQNGVSTLLAGDGGDEIFAGNERYTEQQIFEYYGRLPHALRKYFLSPLIKSFGVMDGINLFRRAANYVRIADTPLPRRLYSGHPLQRNGSAMLFSDEAAREIDPDIPAELIEASYNATSTKSRVQHMMRLDLQITLADNDLRKVTRMCELAGCRVRFPFLDEHLVEFAARIPAMTLVKDGHLRAFYKKAMDGFLPNEILNKQKHGFGMPFDSWVRAPGIMRDLVCDSLSGLSTRGFFRRGTIDRLIDDHLADREGPLSGLVWDLTMLELWWQGRT